MIPEYLDLQDPAKSRISGWVSKPYLWAQDILQFVKSRFWEKYQFWYLRENFYKVIFCKNYAHFLHMKWSNVDLLAKYQASPTIVVKALAIFFLPCFHQISGLHPQQIWPGGNDWWIIWLRAPSQEIFSLSGATTSMILSDLTYLEGQPTITLVDHTQKYIVNVLA